MNLSFNKFVEDAKLYLNNENYPVGHAVILTASKILISVPHGVEQTRLGRHKFKEIGSARLALALRDLLDANLIIKTKNLFDDANFDVACAYRQDLQKIIKERSIKYLIDIHGLASTRPCDINLGINFGDNICPDEKLYTRLKNDLEQNGFVVSVDNPFCGRYPAIAADMHQRYGIWSMQIEVNCALTNLPDNFTKLKKLLAVINKNLTNDVEICHHEI